MRPAYIFITSLRINSTALLCAALATIGCGSSPVAPMPPEPSPGAAITGYVRAAGKPVGSASIALYVAGSTGNGAGASDLISAQTVSTNSSGQFNIAASFNCPSATSQAYLVARGGNPGLASGINNRALVLVAALGDCGNLTIATAPMLNEATTVAAAWALAPFFGVDTGLGSSATNAAGLRHAFALAANLVSTATGTAPGPGLPTSARFETTKLNTLADALAACSRSDGGAACSPLFNAATRGSAVPSTTFDAALNIVRNPATSITTVFAASSGQTAFLPALASPPHDWTLAVTYGVCNSGCGGLSTPGNIAIDSTGNVWVANYFGGAVSRFSPTGVPAVANGFLGVGLSQSYGITVDAADNAWVANQQSVKAANNNRSGSVSKFSSTGAELSGAGYTAGGVFYPKAVAADSGGPIWIANYGNSSATVLANDGSAISGAGGYAASQLNFTNAVAFGGSHNAWFAVQGAAVRVSAQGAANSFPCCNDPEGIALDMSGNVWVADYGGYSIVELSPAGTVLHSVSTAAAQVAPIGIATDGAGNVWTANYFGNSVTGLQGATGTVISLAAGFGLDASLDEPYGIAVDDMGSLWISNSGNSTLTQLVGLASPIRTPLLGLPVQP